VGTKPRAAASLALAAVLSLAVMGSAASAAPRAGGRAAARARAAAVAPSRPLVVLFAYGLYGDPNQAPPGVDPIRNRMAVRAVRDLLRDSNVAEPVVYSPEAPVFVRALQEQKLTLKKPLDPDGTEQVAVGKAVGARFTAFLFVHPPDAQKPGIDMEILVVDVESGKTWGERCRAEISGSAPVVAAGAESGEGDGGGSGSASGGGPLPPNNAVLSAANTLVTKMLAGPLLEYARDTTPPSLLPPPARPVVEGAAPPVPALTNTPPPTAPPVATGDPVNVGTAAAPPTAAPAGQPAAEAVGATTPDASLSDSQAAAERLQGEQLLKAGDTNGALLSLRRAVNLAPRSVPMRAALIQGYLAAKRAPDAIAEARRALTLAAPEDRAGRLELTRLLAEALTQSGDTTAARATYEEIITAQPGSGAYWARLGLAALLEKQGKLEEAEAQYRLVRKADPNEKDAALGLARVLAARGDYEAAIAEMTAIEGEGGQEARYETALRLFDDGTTRIADLLAENREAYENGTLAREVFFRATAAQSARINALLALMKAVPPPQDATELVRKTHRQRVFAASLLTQGVAAILAQLETGDTSAGSQATVFLNEFRTEMNAIRRAEGQAGEDGVTGGVE
jgi:Tfp pilus assembly protein PilF